MRLISNVALTQIGDFVRHFDITFSALQKKSPAHKAAGPKVSYSSINCVIVCPTGLPQFR